MDKETKKWLAIISVIIAAVVIMFLLFSGFDIGGFKIHNGIKIN